MRWHKGRAIREWIKPNGDRNEAWDVSVYNLAIAHQLGLQMDPAGLAAAARQADSAHRGSVRPPAPALCCGDTAHQPPASTGPLSAVQTSVPAEGQTPRPLPAAAGGNAAAGCGHHPSHCRPCPLSAAASPPHLFEGNPMIRPDLYDPEALRLAAAAPARTMTLTRKPATSSVIWTSCASAGWRGRPRGASTDHRPAWGRSLGSSAALAPGRCAPMGPTRPAAPSWRPFTSRTSASRMRSTSGSSICITCTVLRP
ncbi:terminase gpA endonuclease subunit [Delftia sp.]|uniref:terminase gpA endonuclease subunit n=1 Tax=Delftia sp. TaxID=1886637 RepID=UPI00338F704B